MELGDATDTDSETALATGDEKHWVPLPTEELSHQEMQLPRFSHIPPPSIKGCKKWPTSLEAQAFPTDQKPLLLDVLIWVIPYLEVVDTTRLKYTMKSLRRGSGFGPLWFTRPWSPNRRRRWGFGIPSTNRTVVNDKPQVHLMLHFVWIYLTPEERYTMSQTSAPWYLYQKLRQKAILAPISQLLAVRPAPMKPKTLSMNRALLYACALL